jgi:hypothetical protein
VLISDRYSFVFIHIQKTAGSSLRQALLSVDPEAWELGGKHAGIRESTDLPEDYRVFTFVRNPWERLVSWYEMVLAKGKNRTVHKIKSKFYRMVLERAPTFDDFIFHCTDEIQERGMIKSILRNQIEYLVDLDGNLCTDFIGRFENLAEDTRIILAEFGIYFLPPVPHIKQSRNYGDWREYYNNTTRQIVAERFARDIEVFGYAFE